MGYDQGFGLRVGHLHVGTEVIYNFEEKKAGGRVTASLDVHDNMRLSGGYYFYHFDTLAGERDIPTFKEGKRSHEVYGRLSVSF